MQIQCTESGRGSEGRQSKRKGKKEKARTQNTLRRNRSHPPISITPLRLDGKRTLLANAHVQQSLIPSLDDLSFTDVERKWLAAIVRGVELGSVGGEGAAVVDLDFVAFSIMSATPICFYVFHPCHSTKYLEEGKVGRLIAIEACNSDMMRERVCKYQSWSS